MKPPFTVSDTHILCGRFSSSVQLTKQSTINPVTSGLLQLKIVHFFRFDLEIVTRRCSFAFITSGGFCVAWKLRKHRRQCLAAFVITIFWRTSKHKLNIKISLSVLKAFHRQGHSKKAQRDQKHCAFLFRRQNCGIAMRNLVHSLVSDPPYF